MCCRRGQNARARREPVLVTMISKGIEAYRSRQVEKMQQHGVVSRQSQGVQQAAEAVADLPPAYIEKDMDALIEQSRGLQIAGHEMRYEEDVQDGHLASAAAYPTRSTGGQQFSTSKQCGMSKCRAKKLARKEERTQAKLQKKAEKYARKEMRALGKAC